MSHVNLIDADKIDAWFLELVRAKDEVRAEKTARLLSIAIKRHLLMEEKTAKILTAPPADAPNWVRKKWDVAGPFHKFKPERDPALKGKVNHIIDWLVAAQINDAPFLKDLQNGDPKTLRHIKSVDDACAQADKYFDSLNRAFLKASQKMTDDGCPTVMELSNGMRIVEVKTYEQLKREGAIMGHCVGAGGYEQSVNEGYIKIFSLRDKDNNPHVTFEVDVEENSLKQCKGKQDKAPVEKYMPDVEAFVRSRGFKLEESVCFTNLIQDGKGNIYSIYNLPEGFSAESVNFSRFKVPIAVKGMQVGTFRAKDSTGAMSFEDISAQEVEVSHSEGTVFMKEIRAKSFVANHCTGLTSIENVVARTVHVSYGQGPISVKGVKAKKFLANYCRGSLSLADISVQEINVSGCTNLTTLEGVSAEQVRALDCTGLKSLPEDIPGCRFVLTPDGNEFKNWPEARAHWLKQIQERDNTPDFSLSNPQPRSPVLQL